MIAIDIMKEKMCVPKCIILGNVTIKEVFGY